jgi:hypothetical protein
MEIYRFGSFFSLSDCFRIVGGSKWNKTSSPWKSNRPQPLIFNITGRNRQEIQSLILEKKTLLCNFGLKGLVARCRLRRNQTSAASLRVVLRDLQIVKVKRH